MDPLEARIAHRRLSSCSHRAAPDLSSSHCHPRFFFLVNHRTKRWSAKPRSARYRRAHGSKHISQASLRPPNRVRTVKKLICQWRTINGGVCHLQIRVEIPRLVGSTDVWVVECGHLPRRRRCWRISEIVLVAGC